MSNLDELLSPIPNDFDEVDIANRLIKYLQTASVELAALRGDLECALEKVGQLRAELDKRPIMIMTEEMYKAYLTELDRMKRQEEELQ